MLARVIYPIAWEVKGNGHATDIYKKIKIAVKPRSYRVIVDFKKVKKTSTKFFWDHIFERNILHIDSSNECNETAYSFIYSNCQIITFLFYI